MPSVGYYGDALMKAVLSGQVSERRLRQMTERQLTAMIALNMMENSPPDSQAKAVATSPESIQLAREVIQESTVLLKNDNNFLPLNAASKSLKSIVVFGDETTFAPGSTSAGYVYADEESTVTPTEGIANYLVAQVPSFVSMQILVVSVHFRLCRA